MSGNDFILPNDLGWECNDEISKRMDNWFEEFAKLAAEPRKESISKSEALALWNVGKAELMDDIYAIIKKYQKELKK